LLSAQPCKRVINYTYTRLLIYICHSSSFHSCYSWWSKLWKTRKHERWQLLGIIKTSRLYKNILL